MNDKRAGNIGGHQADNQKREASLVHQEAQSASAERALRFAHALIAALPIPLVALDQHLRIIQANPCFCSIFRIDEASSIGQPRQDIQDGLFSIPAIQTFLNNFVLSQTPEQDFQITHHFGALGERTLEMKALRVDSPVVSEGTPRHDVLLMIQDVSERNSAQQYIQVLTRSQQESTAKVADISEELETFGYSVSHDLRAPLRSMDGFSLALLEDYEDKLDDQGKDYLRRIRASAGVMARLLEDLVQLSRLGRTALKITTVDLAEEASLIVKQFRAAEPDRQVTVTIAPALRVSGDRHLLHIAMQNLLNNAWKATSKKADARIEVGQLTGHERPVYYVRDNGIGFNMEYADKLFQSFYRLHPREDFSGSGLGLAALRRIIRRHGGTVWAEGAVDNGATFYFTIDPGANTEGMKEPKG